MLKIKMQITIIMVREDQLAKNHLDRDRKVTKMAKEDRMVETKNSAIMVAIAKVSRVIKVVIRITLITRMVTDLITIMTAIRVEMRDRTIDSKKVALPKDSWMNQWFKKEIASATKIDV